MNTHSTDISVAPRLAALSVLLARLDAACRELSLDETVCLRLQLLAEELFVNTVDHGHPDAENTVVCLRVTRRQEEIVLHYEDQGMPFDPAACALPVATPDLPGGMGIRLIRGLTRALRYRREGSRNIVELVLRPGADQAP